MHTKIDKNLNIVVRTEDEDGNPVIAHHTPLPTPIYDNIRKILTETYDSLASMRVPNAILTKDIFLESAKELDRGKDALDILEQMRGATMIHTSKTALFDVADVSDEVKDEILCKLLFFIVFRRHVFPSRFRAWFETIRIALGLELTSSSVTELSSSTTISTKPEPTIPTDTSLPM